MQKAPLGLSKQSQLARGFQLSVVRLSALNLPHSAVTKECAFCILRNQTALKSTPTWILLPSSLPHELAAWWLLDTGNFGPLVYTVPHSIQSPSPNWRSHKTSERWKNGWNFYWLIKTTNLGRMTTDLCKLLAENKQQSNCTVGKVLALHAANFGSIPDPYMVPNLGVIPEHIVRSKP